MPRALTFEVPERIGARRRGRDAARRGRGGRRSASACAQLEVEAVAVCLLWSIVNPAHELRVGELLDRASARASPFTLSHGSTRRLREYRRASSTCIDASLKPLMSDYLRGLDGRLRAAGFGGRVLIVTSNGGVLDAADVAEAPIHSIGSGPAMAPVAGRYYAQLDAGADTAVVADTGGTSYDCQPGAPRPHPLDARDVARRAVLRPHDGFPVGRREDRRRRRRLDRLGRRRRPAPRRAGERRLGARAGLLRPRRRTADRDRRRARARLHRPRLLPRRRDAARHRRRAGGDRATTSPRRSGSPLEEAAAAVLRVATEQMVRAIEEITLHQGIDPRTAVLVGGGGAAGLNSVAIARRLGCPQVIVPEVGPALSAAGALLSDLTADFAATLVTTTADFDVAAVERTVADLRSRCEEFAAAAGARRRDRALGGGPLPASGLGARGSRARATRRGQAQQATSTPSTRRSSRSAIQAPRSSSSAGARASAVGLGATEPGCLAQDAAPRVGAATRCAYFPGVGTVDAQRRLVRRARARSCRRRACDRRVGRDDRRRRSGRDS